MVKCTVAIFFLRWINVKPQGGEEGGSGTSHGKLTKGALPCVGILIFTRCPRVGNSDRRSYSRGRKLTFSRCLGVGNLTLASLMKMSNSLGLPLPWGLTLIGALPVKGLILRR